MREATIDIINSFVENTFEFADEPNICFEGNFAPVDEIGERVPVKIIDGEVPKDFPAGAYIRNGPNPLFGGKILSSPFGKLGYYWIEGDGMLHGTFFAGDGSLPNYVNKYLNTHGYSVEKDRKKPLYLPSFEGSAVAIIIGYLLNLGRFGTGFKFTSNTSIYQIGEKWYASMEAGLPLEINTADMNSTNVYYDANGAWDRAFTAHPKKAPHTGELVTIGYNPVRPYLQLGVISANGESLVHKVDVGLDRFSMPHDFGVTEKYNIIIDWPLVADVGGAFKRGGIMDFKSESYGRLGVMPRYGDSTSVKWFFANTSFSFHTLNSFDDGDEVVLIGVSSRVPMYPSKPGMDKKEWYARGITTCKVEEAADPLVDGALFVRLHEWRMNMRTGVLTERDLTGDKFSLEMPRINEKYTGMKNQYGYASYLNLKASEAHGMPVFGGILKIDFGSVPREGAAAGQADMVKIQIHDMGPDRHPSEPIFVAKPGGVKEDDGWIVTYVHDDSSGISELVIIDAQDFENQSLVQMQLPQRVPYGFHGAYVLTK